MRLVYGYDQVLPSLGADAEQVFSTVAALSRRGVEIDLLVPRPPLGRLPDAEALKAHYRVTGDFRIEAVGWGGGGPVVRKMGHALRVVSDPRARRATVVYTRHLPVAFAAVARRLPTVYETYRPWPDQIRALRAPLRRLLAHPCLVGAIFHSHHARRSYLTLDVPEERLTVIYNGWDPSRMEPRLERAEARAALRLPVDGPLAVYAGRINARKGLDATLDLARACPEVRFLLVGSSGDGPVERAAAALPNVSVLPWQTYEGTVRYLYAADVLLLPTSLAPLQRHGTTVLPIKLFPYLAAERVILGPFAPDTRELLRDGENAVLVPAGDTPAAAAALRRVLSDAPLARRLAEAARRTAANLTWDARAGRIVEFLERRLAAAG